MTEAERRPPSHDHPYVIRNPSLGLLNLGGDAGSELLARDQAQLGPLFPGNVHVATQTVPRCDVLFIYCEPDGTARVAGQAVPLRNLIKAAGACIAVVASDIPGPVFTRPGFLSENNGWPANIVVTLDRKGDAFGRFFHALFSEIRSGISMPMAWVKLAPQVPGLPNDNPGTVCIMEAGHIAFGE